VCGQNLRAEEVTRIQAQIRRTWAESKCPRHSLSLTLQQRDLWTLVTELDFRGVLCLSIEHEQTGTVIAPGLGDRP
jgi:hypothetical protein